MSDQLTRYLRVLEILKDRRRTNPISVDNVRRLLELNYVIVVTERTVQRDLEYLSTIFLGLDYVVLEKRRYDWYWREDAKVILIAGLTAAQALSFTLIKTYLSQLFPAVALNELEPFFKYSEDALNRIQGNSIVNWPKKIAVVQPTQTLIAPKTNREVQSIVSEVLLTEMQLALEYQPTGQPVKSYTVNPLGLVMRGSVTYLIATKAPLNEFRIFALHRIKNAKALDKLMEQPEGFDLKQFIAEGNMGFNWSDHTLVPIKLAVVFDKKTVIHLYETPLSKDQNITEYNPECVLVTATVMDNEQLYWWLLGFGAQVEVIEPEHLRQKMINTIKGMVNTYSL